MSQQKNFERVRELASQMRTVIDQADFNATPVEKAAALQALALLVANECLPRVIIARHLMDLTETLLDSPGKAPAGGSTSDAHSALTGAAAQLLSSGIGETDASQLMLGFAAAWAAKANTPGAAEHLYRTADTIVSRQAKQ